MFEEKKVPTVTTCNAFHAVDNPPPPPPKNPFYGEKLSDNSAHTMGVGVGVGGGWLRVRLN